MPKHTWYLSRQIYAIRYNPTYEIEYDQIRWNENNLTLTRASPWAEISARLNRRDEWLLIHQVN